MPAYVLGSAAPPLPPDAGAPPLEQGSQLQAKLTINQPDDPYEQEADAVAEEVVDRMSEAGPGPGAGAPPAEIQRACPECEVEKPSAQDEAQEKEGDEEEEQAAPTGNVQPKWEPGANSRANPPSLEEGLRSASAEGRPLPGHVREDMERGFGVDFGAVRIHVGERSAALNRSIKAKAFTHREDIFFSQGRFDTSSIEGRRLLAHELTHVIQQTGSSEVGPSIQRAAELKIGNWAHQKIQERLREKDHKLITEAPIPGATRYTMDINDVGFADFYKAEKQTVSGISAQEPAKSKELTDEGKAFYKYVNLRSNWKAKAQSESDIQFGPKIVSHKPSVWNFSPNFPNNFQVGELKPLFPFEFPSSLGSLGGGLSQVGNYRDGFQKFVSRVYKDNPQQQAQLPSSITGRLLNIDPSNIPDAINYSKFEQERKTHGAGWIKHVDKAKEQRLWMYRPRDGTYVYFLLKDPWDSANFPESVDKQLKQLDPLLAKLRKKRPGMDNNLVQPKRERRDPPARRIRAIPAQGAPVQRKGEDWKADAKAWEDSREGWVAGTGESEKPREFLKHEGQAVEQKAKVDKKLGLRATGEIGQQEKDVRKIRFWSGWWGRILGALRFRFGFVFDKVEEFFDWLKSKFKKHRTDADKLVTKDGIFSGWKKVATGIIIRFAVDVLKAVLANAFKAFTDCVNGLVQSILGKFSWVVDEARKKILEEIHPVCCEVMEFKHGLEEEYNKHAKLIETFTEAVETIQKWRQILNDVEIAVRIGVEILSCETPPGLGCLWGLVAQLGIGEALELISRTDYFEDHIARPAAAALVESVAGDALHNMVIDLLERTPLKPYLEEATECRRRTGSAGDTAIGGHLEGLSPSDPKNAKIRAEWEKKYGPKILADLQKVFRHSNGKPVTKEDLEKLVEAMQKSKLSPAEMKALIESGRKAATGKIALEDAMTHVESGAAPQAALKERKIDYDQATRANAAYQQQLGWDPLTFYPKPGVKADSKEFADAVYDMQEALNIYADGKLGPETVVRFYEKNKLPKTDAAYQNAAKKRAEATAAKEKAAKEIAEKEKAGQKEAGGEGGEGDTIAISVEKPPAGTKILGDHILGGHDECFPSSPGWCAVPQGDVTPALTGGKTTYDPGERLTINLAFYLEKRWVWFPEISGEFTDLGRLNDKLILGYLTREDYYFKLTTDSDVVYGLPRGRYGAVIGSSTGPM